MMQVESKPQFIVFWGSLPWNVASSSLEHSSKQPEPKEVTEEGIVMLVKPEQLLKQQKSKEVTEEGMVILVKPEQPEYLLLVDYQYYTL